VESSFDVAWSNFCNGFRSEETRRSYSKKLMDFLRFAGLNPSDVVAIAIYEPKKLEHLLLQYIQELRGRGLSGSTIRQHFQSIRHFLVMNDAENSIGWSKLSKLMPKAKKIGLDRAPTKEEIRRLLQHADIRMKALILLLVSSGVRIGSVEHLRWRHVSEVLHNGKRFARLVVPWSKGDVSYITFITPEAYETLLEYKRVRESEGEEIGPDSPLFRVAKWSKASVGEKGRPLPASSKVLRNELHMLWLKAGLREPSDGRQHEVKAVHGFRKFFATRLENAGVGRLIVETFMGHNISVASNYYKPSEKELLEQYAKAIPELTISEAEEAKTEMEKRLAENRQRIIELEKINVQLQEKLDQFEKELQKLKQLISHPHGTKKKRR